MDAILNLIEFIVSSLLGLMVIVLIVSAVLSWLVAFDVINLRNPMAARIYYTLERLVEPMLRPIRRFVPPLGGVDLSFIILFLLVQGVRAYIIPPFFDFLRSLV